MKTKIKTSELASMTLKQFKKEAQKELQRAEKEGAATSVVLISDFTFACGSTGAVLIPGELTGELNQYFKNLKNERKAQRDFGTGSLEFALGQSGSTCKINITDGPVKPAQVEKGLKKTKIKINAVISKGDEVVKAVVEDDEETAAPAQQIGASVGKGGKNIKADVLTVQQLLKAKGANLSPDGDCGPKTIAAIEAFQKSLGMPSPDGLISPGGKTWQGLAKSSAPAPTTPVNTAPPANNAPPATTPPAVKIPANLSASVGKGGKNLKDDVLAVQALLEKIGLKVGVDGNCGAKTIAAIEALQKKMGMPSPDGLISPGGKTWQALLKNGGGSNANPLEDLRDKTQAARLAAQKIIDANPIKGNGIELPGSSISTVKDYVAQGEHFLKTYASTGEPHKPNFDQKFPSYVQELLQSVKWVKEQYLPKCTAAKEDLGVGAEDSDAYKNQRDNPMLGESTCNVTTLAMQLISISNDEEAIKRTALAILKNNKKTYPESTQLEELLRQLTIIANGNKEKVVTPQGTYNAWNMAYILDAVTEMFKDFVSKTITVMDVITQKAYMEKIVPALQQGAEVMVSNKLTHGGHICFLVGVRSDGLVINDPYGALIAGAGKYFKNGEAVAAKKEWIKTNKEVFERRFRFNDALKKQIEQLCATGTGNFPTNTGLKNFYSWAEVAEYKIGKWCNVTYKK